MPALSVHLNRSRTRELTAPDTFTARQPFDVVFENHGESTRVHLHPEGALANVIHVADDNRLVGTEATGRVRVEFDRVDRPITGTLELSVGYGAESTEVELTLAPYREDEEQGVDVDETLAKPPRRDGPEDRSPDLPSMETTAIVGLGLVALVMAVVVAAVVDSVVVSLGAALVVLAVIAALVAVLR